jgi:hypothetical protein
MDKQHSYMQLRDKLLHQVTEYDRRQQGKRGYNMWALPQYLGALEQVQEDLDKGVTVRKALTSNFCGRLLDRLLKAAGELPSTLEEQRGW